MSVPSWKTTVTDERPKRETLRSWALRGRPLSAFSMGTVTVRSTSTGESPPHLVKMSTCTLETSGSASMGSLRAAMTPSARTSTRSPATTLRLLIEMATSDSSMFPQRKSSLFSANTPAEATC